MGISSLISSTLLVTIIIIFWSQINPCDHRQLWKGVKQFLSQKTHNKQYNLGPDEINDHFVKISTKTDHPVLERFHKPMEINSTNKSFSLNPISADCVIKTWRKMKNKKKKSCDHIGISNCMADIAMRSENFVTCFARLLDGLVLHGEFPTILKTSRIVPIPRYRTRQILMT